MCYPQKQGKARRERKAGPSGREAPSTQPRITADLQEAEPRNQQPGPGPWATRRWASLLHPPAPRTPLAPRTSRSKRWNCTHLKEITAGHVFNRGRGWRFEDSPTKGPHKEPHGEKWRRKRSVALGTTWVTGHALTPLPGDPTQRRRRVGRTGRSAYRPCGPEGVFQPLWDRVTSPVKGGPESPHPAQLSCRLRLSAGLRPRSGWGFLKRPPVCQGQASRPSPAPRRGAAPLQEQQEQLGRASGLGEGAGRGTRGAGHWERPT